MRRLRNSTGLNSQLSASAKRNVDKPRHKNRYFDLTVRIGVPLRTRCGLW